MTALLVGHSCSGSSPAARSLAPLVDGLAAELSLYSSRTQMCQAPVGSPEVPHLRALSSSPQSVPSLWLLSMPRSSKSTVKSVGEEQESSPSR